ncbi:MAG: alpha/beta hydrolase [Desulfobacterales bacterium]|nr:alpha/beta hydrolase [Desulfobacterales bacterium]
MRKVVIFVHGLGGDKTKSWGNFSRLIDNDETLKPHVLYDFYGFPTCLCRIPIVSKKYPSIQDLSLGLSTFIRNKYPTAEEIILVGHSLGGLVIGKYLIDITPQGTKNTNVKKILLYGVPNTGSGLANVGNLVSWKHRQLKQLCKESDFLDNLNDTWFRLNVYDHFDITCVIGGADPVVSTESLKSVCRNVKLEVIPEKEHIDVNKPTDENDLSFIIFKNVVLKETSPDIKNATKTALQRKIQTNKNNKKYIPDVFLEIDTIKEFARHILDPILCLKKIVYEINCIDFTHFYYVFDLLDIEPFSLHIDESFLEDITITNVLDKSKKIYDTLEDKITWLSNIDFDRQNLRLSEENYKYLIKYDGTKWRITRIIKDFQKRLLTINKKVFLLTERAGQGKTNFICDLAENFIVRKQFLGVMFSGSDFKVTSLDDIKKTLLYEAYGLHGSPSFDVFISELKRICISENITFTIIIDGLNENSDVPEFAKQLYRFIEYLVPYDFIRIIITCRSEYFNERTNRVFSNPSFQDELLLIQDYRASNRQNAYSGHLRHRIVNSYFKYFDVRNQVFNNVRYRLSEDFLLLRIFSEVYGRNANPNAPTDQVYHIFKADLFKAYFDYKFDSLERAQVTYSKTQFKNVFASILDFMIKNLTYTNLPLNAIPGVDETVLECLIHEDIFFRKDLIRDETSAFGNIEVLNFTFDEFRDFLLADYLVINNFDVEQFCSALKEQESQLLEGLLKYLFFMSRKPQYEDQLSFLDKDENLFIENIFAVNETYIRAKDMEKIQSLFYTNLYFSSTIICFLMFRYRTNIYTKLNITLLIQIISSLDNKQYLDLVNPVFETIERDYYGRRYHSPDHFHYDILKLVGDIKPLLKDVDFSEDQEYHNIFHFYLLLLGVRSSKYGETSHKVIDLFEAYISKYPHNARQLLTRYYDIAIDGVRNTILSLLNYCAKSNIQFNRDFCDKLYHQYIELDDRNYSKTLAFRFLQYIYKISPMTFDDDQKAYFEKQEAERQELIDAIHKGAIK